VSKVVTVELQVPMVATPDAVGVHWKTASGEVLVGAQVPLSPLCPLVVPVNTPPAGGITIGDAHVPAPGTVVDVVLVVVVVGIVELVDDVDVVLLDVDVVV